MTTPPRDALNEQRQRERAARDAALGRRASAVLRGDLGPVLRRWVAASVVPVSGRLRACAEGNAGMESLGSPLFGLPTHASRSRSLETVLRWGLKGSKNAPSNLDDLVLAVMGTAITACAGASHPVPLTALLHKCGAAARETAIGQFVTQVQGAKAMMRVRKSGKAGWKQTKQLGAIANLLGGQLKGAVESDEELPIGGKAVLSVVTPSGASRQLTLRKPSADDWELLRIARHVKGEADPERATWVSFAMLVLCAAQAEAGWFDLAEVPREPMIRRAGQHRNRRAQRGLVLSEEAHAAIKSDLDKWLRMGFIYEPMVVPPVNGDYLTVKHREVAGRRGPMGVKTRAEDSAAWHVACETIAATPWTVPEGTLRALRDSEFVRFLAGMSAYTDRSDVRQETILNNFRKVAQEEAVYLPIFMDFRGRVYTRPTYVTYQGNDLQKSLLVFQPESRFTRSDEQSSRRIRAIASHMAVCYGGPEKLDKAPMKDRLQWYWSIYRDGDAVDAACRGEWDNEDLQDLLKDADEPLSLLTAMTLHAPGNLDRIACHLDGTCNGLQHLTALFRDETAAPFVNLTEGDPEAGPCDIYGEVARRVDGRLRELCSGTARGSVGDSEQPQAGGAGPSVGDATWARRLLAAVKIDRKLCKKSVMVLPYGGTRGTIEDACLAGILAQNPDRRVWCLGWHMDEFGLFGDPTFWSDYEIGNYAAFKDRDLKDHPLLHLDARRLGGVVWDVICEMLPKAMAGMQTFRTIAKAVGARTLEWDTGFRLGEFADGRFYGNAEGAYDSLWVTQARAIAARSSLKFKGFQLPGSVRGLSIRQGRDEIDPSAHVSGIVANFIHSNDAAHMAATLGRFHRLGGRGVGYIHDAAIVRPSQAALMGTCLRASFAERYGRIDPLAQPLVLHEGPGKKGHPYASWYALAEECGVSFPEDGQWRPEEVIGSKWFFS